MSEYVDIRKFLPHRKSMLMVDRLVSLSPESVETEYRIKDNSLFLKNNLFVEAGLIENIAQTCSVIAGSTYFNKGDELKENDSAVIGYITNIKTVKIVRLPQVGETLISKGTMLSRFDFDHNLTCVMKGEIHTSKGILLEGLLNLFIKKNHHERK